MQWLVVHRACAAFLLVRQWLQLQGEAASTVTCMLAKDYAGRDRHGAKESTPVKDVTPAALHSKAIRAIWRRNCGW